MLSEKDLKQIAQRGITKEQIKTQLKEFETGFPFLKLEQTEGDWYVSYDKTLFGRENGRYKK